MPEIRCFARFEEAANYASFKEELRMMNDKNLKYWPGAELSVGIEINGDIQLPLFGSYEPADITLERLAMKHNCVQFVKPPITAMVR